METPPHKIAAELLALLRQVSPEDLGQVLHNAVAQWAGQAKPPTDSRPRVSTRTLFKSKIHRATVTAADVDYEGSVTVDKTLLRAADIAPYEKVAIWNVTRGSRLETYALEAEPDSGIICINGAAAHLNLPGDLVIIATYAAVPEDQVKTWKPIVVLVDNKNAVTSPNAVEVPGPRRRETE